MQTTSSGKKEKRQLGATLGAVGSILLWCWSGICFRKGSEAMGAMVYLTFMTGGGALTAGLLQYLQRRQFSDIFRLPGKVMTAGFFGVALYTVMLAAAFGMAAPSDIGLINLLNYLWPIWMVVLGIVLLRDRPRPFLFIAAVLLGFLGVVVSRGVHLFEQPPSSLLPHFLALGGGFLWAMYCVLLRRWQIPEEKGGTVFHFLICSGLAAAIAAFKGEWQLLPPWTATGLFWVLFGAVGPVGLAYYWWEIGVKRGSLNLIATLAYFIPVGSSILISLIFKESMSAGLLPGAMMITAGAWMIRYAGGQSS